MKIQWKSFHLSNIDSLSRTASDQYLPQLRPLFSAFPHNNVIQSHQKCWTNSSFACFLSSSPEQNQTITLASYTTPTSSSVVTSTPANPPPFHDQIQPSTASNSPFPTNKSTNHPYHTPYLNFINIPLGINPYRYVLSQVGMMFSSDNSSFSISQ